MIISGERIMPQITDLSADIIRQILPLLAAKDIVRFALVCRQWRQFALDWLRYKKIQITSPIVTLGLLNAIVIDKNKFIVHGLPGFGSKDINVPFLAPKIFELEPHEYITNFASGPMHHVMLTSKNRLLGIGNNCDGQLAFSPTVPRNDISLNTTLELVELNLALESDEKIKQIAIGTDLFNVFQSHTVILTTRGRVLACGSNWQGQIALPQGAGIIHQESDEDSYSPTFHEITLPLKPNEEVIKIVALAENTLVLTSQNRIIGWGLIHAYILGDTGKWMSVSEPKEVDIGLVENEVIEEFCGNLNQCAVLTSAKRLIMWGFKPPGYSQSIPPTDYSDKLGFLHPSEYIEQIAFSSDIFHMAILTSEGRLFMGGNNNRGQLGLGHNEQHEHFSEVDLSFLAEGDRILKVVLGGMTSIIITKNAEYIVGADYTNYLLNDADNDADNDATTNNFVPCLFRAAEREEYSLGMVKGKLPPEDVKSSYTILWHDLASPSSAKRIINQIQPEIVKEGNRAVAKLN